MKLPPGASTVIITLEPAAGGTMVHLTHEGLPGEQEASHGVGWTHYLGPWSPRPPPVTRAPTSGRPSLTWIR